MLKNIKVDLNKNGHKKTKPALINRRWLNALVAKAIVQGLAPKMAERKISRLRVRYHPSYQGIAERTLSDRFKHRRGAW
jgi:hypothetical protein